MSNPSQTDGSTLQTATLTTPSTLNINLPGYSNGATSTVNAALDQDAEKRIRDLMSAKDKALAELATIQQQALRQQQEMEAKLADYSKKLEGATTATSELMQKAAQTEAEKAKVEAEREQYRAQALKLQALAQHPDLLPYAEFIPATTDEAQMTAAIQKFTQIRQNDLAKVTPSPTAPMPAQPIIPPALQGMYPTQAQTPPPVTTPQPTDLNAVQAQLTMRMKALYANPNDPEFAIKEQHLRDEFSALAKQQIGA